MSTEEETYDKLKRAADSFMFKPDGQNTGAYATLLYLANTQNDPQIQAGINALQTIRHNVTFTLTPEEMEALKALPTALGAGAQARIVLKKLNELHIPEYVSQLYVPPSTAGNVAVPSNEFKAMDDAFDEFWLRNKDTLENIMFHVGDLLPVLEVRLMHERDNGLKASALAVRPNPQEQCSFEVIKEALENAPDALREAYFHQNRPEALSFVSELEMISTDFNTYVWPHYEQYRQLHSVNPHHVVSAAPAAGKGSP